MRHWAAAIVAAIMLAGTWLPFAQAAEPGKLQAASKALQDSPPRKDDDHATATPTPIPVAAEATLAFKLGEAIPITFNRDDGQEKTVGSALNWVRPGAVEFLAYDKSLVDCHVAGTAKPGAGLLQVAVLLLDAKGATVALSSAPLREPDENGRFGIDLPLTCPVASVAAVKIIVAPLPKVSGDEEAIARSRGNARRLGPCIVLNGGRSGGRSYCSEWERFGEGTEYGYEGYYPEIGMHLLIGGELDDIWLFLVSEKNGAETDVDAAPVVSPDHARFATGVSLVGLDDTLRARIMKVTERGAELEWEIAPERPENGLVEPIWLSNTEIRFRCGRTDEPRREVENVRWVFVKLVDGKWQIQE